MPISRLPMLPTPNLCAGWSARPLIRSLPPLLTSKKTTRLPFALVIADVKMPPPDRRAGRNIASNLGKEHSLPTAPGPTNAPTVPANKPGSTWSSTGEVQSELYGHQAALRRNSSPHRSRDVSGQARRRHHTRASAADEYGDILTEAPPSGFGGCPFGWFQDCAQVARRAPQSSRKFSCVFQRECFGGHEWAA